MGPTQKLSPFPCSYFQEFIQFMLLFLDRRFLGGVADAAALGAILSILMKLFPNHTTSVLSWTEMLFGLGYMLGKILGSRALVAKS